MLFGIGVGMVDMDDWDEWWGNKGGGEVRWLLMLFGYEYDGVGCCWGGRCDGFVLKWMCWGGDVCIGGWELGGEFIVYGVGVGVDVGELLKGDSDCVGSEYWGVGGLVGDVGWRGWDVWGGLCYVGDMFWREVVGGCWGGVLKGLLYWIVGGGGYGCCGKGCGCGGCWFWWVGL